MGSRFTGTQSLVRKGDFFLPLLGAGRRAIASVPWEMGKDWTLACQLCFESMLVTVRIVTGK